MSYKNNIEQRTMSLNTAYSYVSMLFWSNNSNCMGDNNLIKFDLFVGDLKIHIYLIKGYINMYMIPKVENMRKIELYPSNTIITLGKWE